MGVLRRVAPLLVAGAALLPLAGGPAAQAQSGPITVEPDRYTGTAPGLAPGQIELAVTSTMAPLVTGGDARMEVRGLGDGDHLTVVLGDGTDVSGAFARDGSVASGVVTGLGDGPNDVTATASGPAGTRTATLEVTNHPITGPVISGPHQEPFICETERSGMGPALDEDCSAPTRVEWFWRDGLGRFHPLTDPAGPYPADTATTTTRDGATVPFVVRVESSVINRSITRIAVLDDPAARGGADAPYEPTVGWNRSVLYQFGESCGTGYHQGRNSTDTVLGGAGPSAENIAGILVSPAARLGEGYAFVHSTLTIFGVHCNQVLSAETTMMVKEHLVEAYGPVEQVLGVGASGGALQQYTVIDGYPGLLDAGIPILSFPDVLTTAMTTVDCGLLGRVFAADPHRWNELERSAVSGLTTWQQCQDWIDLFLDNLHPVRGCSGVIPQELRYDPVANPGGARCTVQDSAVNLLGRDPATGFARRPVDNTGVQYGLEALRAGVIGVQDFLDINRSAGGYDIDGEWQPERMSMSPDLAALVYRYGGVTGRGAPQDTPIIDLRYYVDLVPVLGFHDQVRPYIFDARLTERGYGGGQAIWNGLPLASDAVHVAHQWADAIDAAYAAGGDRATVVADTAPTDDTCVVTTSADDVLPVQLGPLPLASVPGCGDVLALTARTTTRIAAGGPATDDIVKCTLGPVDRGDYPPMTDAQFAQLEAIFPDGVCDWSQPGVGETEDVLTWASVGGDELQEPFAVHDAVARSGTEPIVAAAGAARAGAPVTTDAVRSLPATGTTVPVAVAAVLLTAALALRPRRT